MIKKLPKYLLIFLIVSAWIFSGWPQIDILIPVPRRMSQTRYAKLVFPPGIPSAKALSSGPNNPGTSAGAAAGSCTNTVNWGGTGSPGNASANDTSYIQITGNNYDNGELTDELRLSNFGFSISAASIDGILVETLGWTPAGGANYTTVQLFTSPGTNVGTNKATGALPTTDPGSTYTSWGSSTDTWGKTDWTDTDINSSGFGLALCFTATANNSNINIDHVRITITYTPPPDPANLTQIAYRWFANQNSTDVGGAGGYNTPIIAPKEGTPIRLRLLLDVGGGEDITSTTSVLQVGEKPAGGCSAASFGDVSGTTDIAWVDNSGATDGAALTQNSQDPGYSATSTNHVVINQTYNESNNFTSSQGTVDAGASMLFDFALSVSTTSIDTTAKGGKTYCFRGVQEGGGTYEQEGGGGYNVYPELTIEKPDKLRLRGHVRLRVVRLR